MRLLSRLRRTSPAQAVLLEPSPIEEKDEDVFDTIPVLVKFDDDDLEGDEADNAALDVVADMLYRSCWPLGWMPFKQVESEQWLDEVVLGVSIRSDDGVVRSCPAEHEGLREFEEGVGMLHATVALKFTCKAVEYMVKYYL